MEIITKEVEIKPTGKMLQYYRDKGYNAKFKEPLMVKVDDLPKRSNENIEVLCDFCKTNKMTVRYADYCRIIEKTGSYVCSSCSSKKKKITDLSKYGSEYYFQTDDFKEKCKETLLCKYGVTTPLKIKEVQMKIEKTCLEKYGYKSSSQSPLIREKVSNTFLERYGVENPMQLEEFKLKAVDTCIKKYGVPNPLKSASIKEKANKTLCENGTQKTSSQQLYLHFLYGGEINYPISYYATDICFPDEKLCIEYDGGGHRLRVELGLLTNEEFDQKELIRNNILKREGYKQMRIISSKDLLPSDEILLQLLSYTKEYFSNYPEHSWIEYNIDSSSIRNAEQKDGVFFNYGELRKIKTCA